MCGVEWRVQVVSDGTEDFDGVGVGDVPEGVPHVLSAIGPEDLS